MKIVTKFQGQAVTTSRMIAEVFGKKHFHILRDIEKYIEEGHLEVNPDLDAPFSVKSSTYIDASKRESKEYIVSADACTLVIMAYTGFKSMKFKKAYITQFNNMRRVLTERNDILDEIDEERNVGCWEDAKIPGYHGVLEELGL